jgi:hypothetical protein
MDRWVQLRWWRFIRCQSTRVNTNVIGNRCVLTLEDAFLDELLSGRAVLELCVECVLAGGPRSSITKSSPVLCERTSSLLRSSSFCAAWSAGATLEAG